jgi:2-hydroxychromene-2-carboxylate isomerase
MTEEQLKVADDDAVVGIAKEAGLMISADAFTTSRSEISEKF